MHIEKRSCTRSKGLEIPNFQENILDKNNVSNSIKSIKESQKWACYNRNLSCQNGFFSIFLQLFASSLSRSIRQNYQFSPTTPDDNLCAKTTDYESNPQTLSVIEKLETIETLRATLSLHHDIGTFVQSRQEFTLKGKLLL